MRGGPTRNLSSIILLSSCLSFSFRLSSIGQQSAGETNVGRSLVRAINWGSPSLVPWRKNTPARAARVQYRLGHEERRPPLR
uniref:Putative secreted protein n=1 Tax=Ixodes ricinus TaxID=34613 RepID=A0A6B0U726_IXORI